MSEVNAGDGSPVSALMGALVFGGQVATAVQRNRYSRAWNWVSDNFKSVASQMGTRVKYLERFGECNKLIRQTVRV